MLSRLWSKAKTYVIVFLIALGPVLYWVGRILSKQKATTDRVEDAAQSANDAAEFYKEMAEHEKPAINSRADLTDRLRNNGL